MINLNYPLVIVQLIDPQLAFYC